MKLANFDRNFPRKTEKIWNIHFSQIPTFTIFQLEICFQKPFISTKILPNKSKQVIFQKIQIWSKISSLLLSIFYGHFWSKMPFFLKKKTNSFKCPQGGSEELIIGKILVNSGFKTWSSTLLSDYWTWMYRRPELGRNLEFWQLKDRF